MSPRSEEFMTSAVARLRTARGAGSADPAGAVSAAYYAALYAARAALSERDHYAKTHAGTWHLFREHFVLSGEFDADLYRAAARMQQRREAADYDAATLPEAEAAALIAVAERFVAAIGDLLA